VIVGVRERTQWGGKSENFRCGACTIIFLFALFMLPFPVCTTSFISVNHVFVWINLTETFALGAGRLQYLRM